METAENGEEALRLLKEAGADFYLAKGKFQMKEFISILSSDVITLDLRMPGMDGLKVTEKIMDEKPAPILILTIVIDGLNLVRWRENGLILIPLILKAIFLDPKFRLAQLTLVRIYKH